MLSGPNRWAGVERIDGAAGRRGGVIDWHDGMKVAPWPRGRQHLRWSTSDLGTAGTGHHVENVRLVVDQCDPPRTRFAEAVCGSDG